MQYTDSSWHRPYGSEEGLGFGHGDGAVVGEIEGSLVWANYPRRREDGVWTPNLRGMIRTTADGYELVVSMHGQSVQATDAPYRAILARVELTTDAERYRWLNTCFVVGEGEIDEETEKWWIHAFVCVNEVAEHPPGIGQAPPEAFR